MAEGATKEAAAQRARLAALLAQRAAAPKDTPLSAGQARLWRIVEMAGDVPVYNLPAAWTLGAQVDADAISRASHALARRYDVLRAGFPIVDGNPVQRTLPSADAPNPFEIIELEHDSALAAAAQSRACAPFDLTCGPLWRLSLLRSAQGTDVLCLVMHHMICDGRSFEIVLGEIEAVLSHPNQPVDEVLPPPKLQYTAWSAREDAARIGGDSWGTQTAYWQTRFAEPVPPLQLPYDGSGTAARASALHLFTIGRDLPAAAVALGKSEGATPFMVYLAAFTALMQSASEQTDLVLCTPVSGRRRSGARQVVGYCNNILPVHLRVPDTLTFRELVRHAREEVLDGHRAQDVPFQDIATARGLARAQLGRVVFSHEAPWPPDLSLLGVRATKLPIETGVADFDLAVILYDDGPCLRGSFRHKTGLISPARAQALSDGFETILTAVMADPDAPLANLPRPLPAADVEGGPSAGDLSAGTDGEAPRGPLEVKLSEIWSDVLALEDVPRDLSFAALGASSLSVARIAERLTAEYGVDYPLPSLFAAGTIKTVADTLSEGTLHDGWDPLIPIRPGGEGVPLILIEGVGVYYDLVECLAEGRPIWALVRSNTAPIVSVETTARAYAERLIREFPTGALALGGLSGGGLIAFEVARALRQNGREVPLVALFDSPAPGAFVPFGRMRRLYGHLRKVLAHGIPYLQKLRQTRLKRKADTSSEADLISDHASIRASYKAAVDSHVLTPLEVELLLFRVVPSKDTVDLMFDPVFGRVDPLLGWGAAQPSGLEIVDVTGGHIEIMRPPTATKIAAAMDRRLP